MNSLSIVIPEDKTQCLDIPGTVPYAVVLPHTLFVSDGVVRGVALHGCNEKASFEMTEEEFLNLQFEEAKS